MIIKTGRFGQLVVGDDCIIEFPQGLLGFPDHKKFCLVDPGDDTLILWLQALEDPSFLLPVLEPKIFQPNYVVSLSAQDQRELKTTSLDNAAVLSILTIPEKIHEMAANLKAPLVINLKDQVGKQVVLQENEYNIRHPMFKELRTHLVTIESTRRLQQKEDKPQAFIGPVRVGGLPISSSVSI